MADVAALVAEMCAVSAGGRVAPSPAELCRLSELTALLVDADTNASAEYDRFVRVRGRCLDLDSATEALHAAYAGKRILITGGTGCIGKQLATQLRELGAGPIYSISRGRRVFRPVPGVEYLTADVRDAAAVDAAVASCVPDVVFHLAAQRDPGLAERALVETVETNAVGTLNVLRAARAHDVPQLSHASTGKAMRYHTRSIYATSKKLAEWLLFDYENEGGHAGGARFTHVVDNSIVYRNFERALSGGIIRLHDPDIVFYVQSAAESAQLLLLAGLAQEPGFWLAAIRDLDEPVRLMSMALGLIARSEERPPLWLSGYEPGYEHGVLLGLYDPRTASDLSPLINALEAPSAVPLPCAPTVDKFVLTLPASHSAEGVVDDLARACDSSDHSSVAELLSGAGHRMTLSAYDAADPSTLLRVRKLAERGGRSLPFMSPEGAVSMMERTVA